MSMRATLPEKYLKQKRRTIVFEFKDKTGVFFCRDINLHSDEYDALKEAFYKLYKNEEKERLLS